MHVRFAVAALAALATVPGTLPAQAPERGPTVVYGTLLGADGAPMKLAHVHIYRALHSRGASRALVGADGRYAIATQYTGALRVQFTGVDHYSAAVPLYLERPGTIRLDVRLRHYEYTDSLDRITAIGDFNGNTLGTGRPLVRRPDGTYTLEVEAQADTLAYELMGLEKSGNRSINGTQAGKYSYDNGGDYRSVIPARDGHATIVFDPGALRRVPGELRVVFGDSASREARIYGLIHAFSAEQNVYFDSARAARARKDSTHYDWAPALARLRTALRREREPFVQRLLLFQLMDATTMASAHDTAVARRIIAEVPPSSPLFSLMPNALNSTVLAYRLVYGRKPAAGAPPDTALNRRLMERYGQIADENPDSAVQSEALAEAVFFARSLHDDAKMNDYYTRLVTHYPDEGIVAYLKSQLSPNRVLRVGAQIPDFHFAALEDSTVTYSRESMAGKTYLLSFWATWCGPCIGEMKYLQAAHDSLASEGLEIVSVSLDQRAEDVRRFRQGEWKMPWLHAFAPGGFENAQVRRMEVIGIPRAALVGKDGRILAVDEQLRGDSLTATIRRAIQPAASP
jgi:thiol-disulfide isomerase/thioredoxin